MHSKHNSCIPLATVIVPCLAPTHCLSVWSWSSRDRIRAGSRTQKDRHSIASNAFCPTLLLAARPTKKLKTPTSTDRVGFLGALFWGIFWAPVVVIFRVHWRGTELHIKTNHIMDSPLPTILPAKRSPYNGTDYIELRVTTEEGFKCSKLILITLSQCAPSVMDTLRGCQHMNQ